MAHNVVIRKVALLSKKDGHVLKGKYAYFVKCKRCGKLHEEKITSESLAKRYEDDHHMDVRGLHSLRHPNDEAARRVHYKKKAAKRA